ncbi:uncharacterized protein LOC104907789 [Beta vulgaris subsp. vulgaris]|uniref:uncharacterized protein LOC104907789 n=1 Tax=Beta vulgaris subsp. vulgaris TaxID=3555 RepID=UPI00053FC603|nr:uncharacterized protein LOC104907789 [Beta vulgaris subsp. vulgaris]
MGFKDSKVFNDALLGRQAWRPIRKPNSLFGRVMKAKYYPNSDFIDASLGYYCSFSWKIIWSSKALVKEGCIWRIGIGENVRVWDAPWVADDQGRFITSAPCEGIHRVCDLIDTRSGEWNFDLLEERFSDRDRKCILSIPLCVEYPQRHEMTWALSKDGLYSVKTAYLLGKGLDLDSFHQAWVVIWKIDDNPKVRHFLWRLCSHSLPTKALLKYRHLIEEDACPWCCGAPKTDTHVLFECPRIVELWRDCCYEDMCVSELGIIMCDRVASWKLLDKKLVVKGCFLMWCIWGERNQWVFNGKRTQDAIIIARVPRLVDKHDTFTKRIYHSQGTHVGIPKSWQAPPEGFVNINVDASLAVDGWVGLSVVARGSHGNVLFAASRRQKAHWAPKASEAKALAMGVHLGKRFGFKEVIIESDCQTLVNRLSKSAIFLSDLDAILHNILSSCTSFSSIIWSHVLRDGNFVAHHLAKLVLFGTEQIWENHAPVEVAPYVLMDTLFLN